MRGISTGAAVAAALAALSVGSAAPASEAHTYTYDALGRLISDEGSGTVNANKDHSLCYDKAGNRTRYKATTTGGLASCITIPTPAPILKPNRNPIEDETPDNRGPVARLDQGSTIAQCTSTTLDVLANDSDPDGDPLTVTAVVPAAGLTVTIASPGSLEIRSDGGLGTKKFSYTVGDGRGGTDTGAVEVTVAPGTCPDLVVNAD